MELNHLISPSKLRELAQKAYEIVSKSGFLPDSLAAPTLAGKHMTVVRFAQAVTKQKYKKPAVICECSLPQNGYVSWLLVRPLGIAFDSDQVLAWLKVKGDNAPRAETQVARAIIHELGHIFAHPGLLSRRKRRTHKEGGKTFTEPSTPFEEEEAWVWAMCVFAIALGSHAWHRRQEHLCDETITFAV